MNVVDATAPTFACPGPAPFTLDLCDEYTLTPADLGLSGTDNCGGTYPNLVCTQDVKLVAAATQDCGCEEIWFRNMEDADLQILDGKDERD